MHLQFKISMISSCTQDKQQQRNIYIHAASNLVQYYSTNSPC